MSNSSNVKIYCHVCGRVGRAFSREPIPPGLASNVTYFTKCEDCIANTFTESLTADIFRRAGNKGSFALLFYECRRCGGLFFCEPPGVPYALQYEVKACPNCGEPLPTLSDAATQKAKSQGPLVAFWSHVQHSPEDVKMAYERIREVQRTDSVLGKLVEDVLLVKTAPYESGLGRQVPEGYQVWILHRTDSMGQDLIGQVVRKQMRQLFGADDVTRSPSFSSSQQFDYAIKNEYLKPKILARASASR